MNVRAWMGIVALLLLSFLSTAAYSQTQTIYVAPALAYSVDPYGGAHYYSPLSQAWANAIAEVAAASNANWSDAAENLHPDTGTTFPSINGSPGRYFYDLRNCYVPTGSCQVVANWGYILTEPVCPNGSDGGKKYSLVNNNEVFACALAISPVQPPPKDCLSCIGNPILASSGQKVQVETDYEQLPGLSFSRVYRSGNGLFSSLATTAFIDNSTNGTSATGCVQGTLASSNITGSYCFPYMSVYPYVNGGVQQYQLSTEDGRTIAFS